jgi:pimeloyl-ACP methyl ester carboxylesterase
MYYEVHGAGEPLVVLHGAYMIIDAMGEIVPRLAETRQVVAIELQGHGRTADIDCSLSYEHLADDVAALLRHLGIEDADVFVFSMGSVALQVAIRHPEVVRKLVVASASHASNHMHAELLEMIPSVTPELFAGFWIEEDYLRSAPLHCNGLTCKGFSRRANEEPKPRTTIPPDGVRLRHHGLLRRGEFSRTLSRSTRTKLFVALLDPLP